MQVSIQGSGLSMTDAISLYSSVAGRLSQSLNKPDSQIRRVDAVVDEPSAHASSGGSSRWFRVTAYLTDGEVLHLQQDDDQLRLVEKLHPPTPPRPVCFQPCID